MKTIEEKTEIVHHSLPEKLDLKKSIKIIVPRRRKKMKQ
jgi:hypothetical protein